MTRRASYTTETVIGHPFDEVFDYLSELRNGLAWNPGARRIEKLTRGPVGVGSRFHAQCLGAPRTEVTITGYEPPFLWQTDSRSWASTWCSRAGCEPSGRKRAAQPDSR